MAKYKIQVIGHALKNNAMAYFGDVVEETQLTTNAADLVNQGFIKLHVEKPEDTESESDEDDELAILNNRKEILINLGFENVDSDNFKGLTFPDSEVSFSDEDILNASLEEFDGFVEKSNEYLQDKADAEALQAKLALVNKDEQGDPKKENTPVSKKDEVKNSLTKK